MKRVVLSLFAVTAVLLLATPADARRGGGHGNDHGDSDSNSNSDSDSDSDSNGGGQQGGQPGGPSSVPELDTSVAGSAAVLLGGGLALALGRRRRVK